MAHMVQIMTTVDSLERAKEIAQVLISERLAGCVQIDGPIHSCYRWEGQVQNDQEWRCTIKTTDDYWPRIEQRFASLHPYDVPELLASKVEHCSAAYAAWLRDQLEA